MSDEQAITMLITGGAFGFLGYLIGWAHRDAQRKQGRESARSAARTKVCEPKISQLNQIRKRLSEEAHLLVESPSYDLSEDQDILELELQVSLKYLVQTWLEENNYVLSEENADRVIQALRRKYPDITTIRPYAPVPRTAPPQPEDTR